MQRRSVTPFSLSFLDIMFCGFGAVVLLGLIMNADAVNQREQVFADHRAEIVRLEREMIVATDVLLEARGELEAVDFQLESHRASALATRMAIEKTERETAGLESRTAALREQNRDATSALRELAQKKTDAQEKAADRERGRQIHEVPGDGERQYLTGLRLGGRRILVLLDASASMLDETIVNVLRRRNMPEADKLRSPKWQRAVATSEWIIANLPRDIRFQVYAFNAVAGPAVSSSLGTWMETGREDDVKGVVEALRAIVPKGGTSLYNAFDAAAKMAPPPDNIILVTDGLPTQGAGKPGGTTVTGEQRLAHFGRAKKELPARVPVNTILFPMEGDAYAAAAFWKLAVDTEGSFLTPARDWP